METVRRIKQIAFSLGIIGFIPAMFLCAQTLGMGMRTDELKAIKFGSSPDLGLTTLEEMALRYCLISVCFLLFIVFVVMRDKVFLKATGMIPLVFIVVQYGFLIILKKGLFNIKWTYSSWLEITYYMDFGFLALAVVLMILQMFLILRVHRLSIHSSL
ncbi:MAG: hypothetical protein H0U45_13595 [Tatlockia sp.]|jgi:hypothetical protein|nr:hypothetical protein [Tatlockia sp.]